MSKFHSLEDYVDTFNVDAKEMYEKLRDLIWSTGNDVKERLFAGQVAFYIDANLGKTFHESPVIIMSFLKDHVNIFASASLSYKDYLSDYKFTEKGTMQIDYDKELDIYHLSRLFIDSLC